jgi:integrase
MATKLRLTKAAVEALPTPAKRTYYRDTAEPKLGLAVTPAGHKSYHAVVVIGGKTQRVTLGTHPALSVELARRRAREAAVAAAEGRDPVREKRERRRRGMTLGRALEDYIAAHDLRATTEVLYRRELRLSCPDWLDKPLEAITERMVLECYQGRKAQSLAGAERFLRTLTSVWRYMRAVTRDAEGRPCIGPPPTDLVTMDRQRRRVPRRQTVIAERDLPAWWDAVLGLEPEVRDYVLLLATTGMRRTEAVLLDWQEVDLHAGTITLRAETTKTGKPRVLPLPEYTADLLRPRASRSGAVFPTLRHQPNLHHSTGPVGIVRRVTGIQWTLHDLRRFYATVGADLDVSPYVVKALLGHTLGDVTAGYTIVGMPAMRNASARIVAELLRRAGVASEQPLRVVR